MYGIVSAWWIVSLIALDASCAAQESGRPEGRVVSVDSSTRRHDDPLQGVAIVIAPFDNFAQSWGVRADLLRDAGNNGVINAGWHVSDGSPFLITVAVSSLTQTEEDLYAFRIDVHGGESELLRAAEDSTRWIPDIAARRTINVPKDGNDRLSAEVNDMVEGVAAKLRSEILRRNGEFPPTELQR